MSRKTISKYINFFQRNQLIA
nr:hypothetical protein [Maribacter vaceletii]